MAKALKGLRITLEKAPKEETPPPAEEPPKEETPPLEETPKEETPPVEESPKEETPPVEEPPKEETPPKEEEVVDIPDDAETNAAATKLQNLQRAKEAKAKVEAKRAELKALADEEKKIEDEAAAQGVTEGMTEAELEEMASGPEADKAATMLQSLQRKKEAIKKVEAKKAELKAAEEEAAKEKTTEAPPTEEPKAEEPKTEPDMTSPRVASKLEEAKELDAKLNPDEGEKEAPKEETPAA